MIYIFLIIAILFIFLKIKSPQIKGSIGEKRVALNLSFLDSTNYKILNDVILLNKSGKTSQIDHVVVSVYGIFVIETKNYKGWIFGKENAENWMQVLYKEKHQFRNPIKQNFSHIYALKEMLTDFPNLPYFPIVVFAGSATLKEIESSAPVIYANQLNATIRRLSVSPCLTIEEVDKIVAILNQSNIDDKKIKKEHIKNINDTIYEKKMKESNLICPRCNGELKLRKGKYGDFYGCANYPRCRFTMKR